MDTERTLVLIKPDGVVRGLVGDVVGRIERKGLRLAALELRTLDRETAQTHYAEHREKPFFASLVDFITSGPLVAAVVEGPRAIEAFRSSPARPTRSRRPPAASGPTTPSRCRTTSCTAPTRPSRPSVRSPCSSRISEQTSRQTDAGAGAAAASPCPSRSARRETQAKLSDRLGSVETMTEPPADSLVYARGLTKRFDGFTAVDGIDVDVHRGEAFGFLGPNGAGKSSTMRMIGCVSPVTAGTLRVLGLDPATRRRRHPRPARRRAPGRLARHRADRHGRTSSSTGATSACRGR